MAKKENLAKEVQKLAVALGAHGLINGDEQSLFLSQAITLVLHAGQKADHAAVLSSHLLRATEDLLLLCGEEDAKNVLSKRAIREMGAN